ncbi:MAG: sigma-E factor negative regulatory protein RseA [Candidatus Paceibacteria bacterium]
MTDKIKETLSAWVDDEASEIEIHRLLRQYDADDSVRQTGLSYQHARSLTRGDGGDIGLSLGQHLTLHQRISVAIDVEEITHADHRGLGNLSKVARLSTRLPLSPSTWVKPASGLALAASLVVAVFLGLQPGQIDSLNTAGSTAVNTSNGGSGQAITAPINVQAVSTNSGQQASAATYAGDPAYQFDKPLANDHTDLKALDEDKQRQLRAYLRQHDQMARMNPNARTVIYEAPQGAPLRHK